MAKSALVPNLPSDFSKSTYWESFFKKRIGAFEWYGTYYELCGILHRYIKPQDRTLMAGCGNSELSEQMFDAGLENIVNIDISQTVVDQMMKRRGPRSSLEYLKMDLTDLKFDPESFSVIVDKGTLDAIMSDDTTQSHDITDKIFSEYSRVIKNGGRYICITLAQDFILRKIMDYFPSNEWLVRVHKVSMSSDDQSKVNELPVFAFVMTKFKNLPKKIFEICADDSFTPTRVKTEKQIIGFVKSQQYYSALKSNIIREVDPSRECPAIELFTTKDSSNPRFTLHVVDRPTHNPHCKFAVFIVPQGRENESLFSTDDGRAKIAEQTSFQRVLFVSLHPAHEYGSRDQVQGELNSSVMDFAPPGIQPSANVPYLSTSADDIGQRRVKFKGNSLLTGPYLVEDYLGEGNIWHRHLLFMTRKSVIQCEIKLRRKEIPRRKGNQRNQGRRDDASNDDLVPDLSRLTSQYAEAAFAGLVLRYKQNDHFNLMVIGVGGGTLSSFILNHFHNCKLTAVEIDSTLIMVGYDWFGLPRPEAEPRFKVHIADGLEFVHAERKKIENSGKDSVHYDVIILDVDVKDPSLNIACPPVKFLEEEYLESILEILSDDGLFMVNLLCRSDEIKASVMRMLQRKFKVVAKFHCQVYYNEMVYCFKGKLVPDVERTPVKPKQPTRANRKKNNRKSPSQKVAPKLDAKALILEPIQSVAVGNANDVTTKMSTVDDVIITPKVADGVVLEVELEKTRIRKEMTEIEHVPGKIVAEIPEKTDLKFIAPRKDPVPIQAYKNRKLYEIWGKNASFWERDWTRKLRTKPIELNEIVEQIVIEQEDDCDVTNDS